MAGAAPQSCLVRCLVCSTFLIMEESALCRFPLCLFALLQLSSGLLGCLRFAFRIQYRWHCIVRTPLTTFSMYCCCNAPGLSLFCDHRPRISLWWMNNQNGHWMCWLSISRKNTRYTFYTHIGFVGCRSVENGCRKRVNLSEKKKRLREGSNAEKSGQDEDEDQERKQTSTVVAGFVEERRWAASTERSPRYSYLLLYQVYIKQLYSNRSCIRTYWY